MSWKSTVEPYFDKIPSVARPTGHVPFNRKLMWTGLVLLVYFYLTNVLLFGLPQGNTGTNVFGQFRSILAGSQGTLLTLGIGPIVTGSIILQLLSGADLMPLDTSDPRDQMIYQNLQKVLVMVVAAITAAIMVWGGNFIPASPRLARFLGIPLGWLEGLLFLQLFFGGMLVLYLDEIVSKWGVGSGVGLFIIAGISQRLIGGIFAIPALGGTSGILYNWYRLATGQAEIGSLFAPEGLLTLLLGPGNIIPILTTVLIVTFVVYAESVRVEVPISHSQVKGARGSFPIKLIYASVLPMILVRALQANIQFFGRFLNSAYGEQLPAWVGTYSNGQPVGGVFYYLAPIQRPQDWMWWLSGTAASNEIWQVLLRVGIDLSIMVVGGAVFAIFWVETTGMGPEDTAEQLQSGQMQIPGFRRNTQSFERVLQRYIPFVTVLGGAIVGVLAVLANMLGTIGGVTGTGLLLSVSITYKLYEEIAEEKLMDIHPMMRTMFGQD